IVTGASDGLGQAVALCFAENGMKVIVADINAEKGVKLVEEIKSQGGEATFLKTDVSLEEDVKELTRFAVETYGRLDGIVNNAGISAESRPTHEYSTAEFDRLMSINLKGVF